LRRFARVLAVAGAMTLGALGTVALASPASATNSKITYDLKCGPEAGTASVAWTLENEVDADAVVRDLSRKLNGIANGDTVKAKQKVTGTEDVAISAGKITLSLTMKWGNVRRSVENTADLSTLDCSPAPVAEFTDNCDKTMLVKVTNPEGGKAVKIAVNGSGTFVERKELAPGESWEVTVPADNSEHVRVKYPGGDQIADHNWKKPEVCYSVSHKSTCDKLTITVTNEGSVPLTASVKVGDKEETTEIPVGQSDTATFKGVEGLVVTLTVGKKSTEIKYAKPADCAPLLPVTGVNAGLLAGAAFVLVSGGGGMYFLARRRRIRFAV
jgi:hypothetical protein